MKRYFYVTILLFLCCACVENTVDSQHVEEHDGPRTLRSLLTKSSMMPQEDSLTIMSKLQSDVDNLMMGRVLQRTASLYLP